MPRSSVALQFRAEAYDHPDGSVDAGTVMTWIDKTAYAAAARLDGVRRALVDQPDHLSPQVLDIVGKLHVAVVVLDRGRNNVRRL